MKRVVVKAVIIWDGGENYFLHGTNGATPQALFKTMAPLWDFDPSMENAHYVELGVELPQYEDKLDSDVLIMNKNDIPS